MLILVGYTYRPILPTTHHIISGQNDNIGPLILKSSIFRMETIVSTIFLTLIKSNSLWIKLFIEVTYYMLETSIISFIRNRSTKNTNLIHSYSNISVQTRCLQKHQGYCSRTIRFNTCKNNKRDDTEDMKRQERYCEFPNVEGVNKWRTKNGTLQRDWPALWVAAPFVHTASFLDLMAIFLPVL